jgi:hypothetical protein
LQQLRGKRVQMTREPGQLSISVNGSFEVGGGQGKADEVESEKREEKPQRGVLSGWSKRPSVTELLKEKWNGELIALVRKGHEIQWENVWAKTGESWDVVMRFLRKKE